MKKNKNTAALISWLRAEMLFFFLFIGLFSTAAVLSPATSCAAGAAGERVKLEVFF